MISIQALKKAASRGTVLGVVIAAHLALALLVLVPAAPRPVVPALRRGVHRAAVLRITLLRPPPPPPAPPSVPRPQRAPVAVHARARSVASRAMARPARQHATTANRTRIFHIVGSVLESPRGLLRLPHGAPAATTLGRALQARIGRLANGRLAIQIPGLPGAPCFALLQHFKNPNNHGLHLIARIIAEILTPPRMLPYVLKVTSVPDPQPIACHPVASKVNHVFDLPAQNLLAPPATPGRGGARGATTRAARTHPAKSTGQRP
ncbi:MAG TPA: hypothetical protein VF292_12820 [Rhodanobacteraceae bacterium]